MTTSVNGTASTATHQLQNEKESYHKLLDAYEGEFGPLDLEAKRSIAFAASFNVQHGQPNWADNTITEIESGAINQSKANAWLLDQINHAVVNTEQIKTTCPKWLRTWNTQYKMNKGLVKLYNNLPEGSMPRRFTPPLEGISPDALCVIQTWFEGEHAA